MGYVRHGVVLTMQSTAFHHSLWLKRQQYIGNQTQAKAHMGNFVDYCGIMRHFI